MEIPVINRISDFEVGINSLQNPSFFSQVSSSSGIEKVFVFQAYSLWKWGAVIIALIATLSRLINRIKILIIRFRQNNSLLSEPLLKTLDDDDYSSDDDSETPSCSSSDDEDDEDLQHQQIDEDFCVAGSSYYSPNEWQNRSLKLRRRRRSLQDLFSWSEFANGNSVVKLWDNLGLGLDLNNSSDKAMSIYDMNKETKISSIFGRNLSIPATSVSSQPLIVTAESGDSRNIELKFWDTRVGCQIPAILAEWRPRLEKIVSVYCGGGEKVYVESSGAAGLTVGDVRSVGSPFADFTESTDRAGNEPSYSGSARAWLEKSSARARLVGKTSQA